MTCNNEVLKMQRASLDQLANMTGIEFCLLYVQDPILYVIRKQHRNSPTQTTPISDYYIVAGTIYQAPDLCSVVNSRLLSAISHLQGAFEEARSYVKYHPAKGYTWDFQQNSNNSNTPYGAKKIPGASETDSKKTKKSKRQNETDTGTYILPKVRPLTDCTIEKFTHIHLTHIHTAHSVLKNEILLSGDH